MTTDIYTAVCKDQDRFLKQLMGVGTGLYNVQLWEGTKIWPGIARRMTCIQLAVREGELHFTLWYLNYRCTTFLMFLEIVLLFEVVNDLMFTFRLNQCSQNAGARSETGHQLRSSDHCVNNCIGVQTA